MHLQILAAILIASIFPVESAAQEAPDGPRGDLDYIADWLHYDFAVCLSDLMNIPYASCVSEALYQCNDSGLFYRHCNVNMRFVVSSYVRDDLHRRSIAPDLIESWIDATSAFCGQLEDFWLTNPEAPPPGLAADNSFAPCFLDRVFDVYDYLPDDRY